MEFKGLRRASMASSGETTAAASDGSADLAAAAEDELQGSSEFLPAGACHATEAAKAAAQTVIQAALVSVRNASEVAEAVLEKHRIERQPNYHR